LKVSGMLKQVVEREGKQLTGQILDGLNNTGIQIGRRTVSKYRIALAILPSALR
jgi:DNA-directed RNA polymerase specialized sigma54-like protein